MSKSNIAAIRISASKNKDEMNRFGFWTYVMTDCMLFAALFATYAVLHNNVAGGPSAKELFDLPFVLTETMILLTSSFVCGLALIAANQKNKKILLILMGLIFLLGSAFVAMELYEFQHLVHTGNSWTRSAFLSSYFALVGTHGAHIIVGLIWLAVLAKQVIKHGITPKNLSNLAIFGIFWHFLDVVWIFIFSFVYLAGVAL